jgi:putative lipoprotein (rSAM/lipoprotein system)
MKLLKIESGIYKRILGLFGAAGFIVTFQACYGTPQNFCTVSGSVNDKETGVGIPDLQVKVFTSSDSVSLTTDENGNFNQTIAAYDDINIKIVDTDAEANNSYSDFDTIVTNQDHELTIKIKKN